MMKSILTVVTDGSPVDTALAQAEALATAMDGHLDLFCLGVDRTQTGYYYAGANAMVLQETVTRAAAEATELEDRMRKRMANSEARWGIDTGVAQLADIGRSVGMRARFADVTVMPMPYGKDRGAECEGIAEGILFEGRAPILVMPDGHAPVINPKRIMIGWDESNEAMSTVRAALPMLMRADLVNVIIVDPPVHGPNRSDPGGQLSQFLARHGVTVEIDVLSKTMPRVSDILMRQATDTDAEMLVMGGYGHSRFREALLGGATRDMLEKSPVPIFMAH
ncbi:universal stress protein [Mesobacterium pallidum]|uniref:universal stress protein n=1 Tax=Mesobacterium pallidum TaxID=2872037 RepID=UPI001EE2B869|nr:universal stress protein [Mesobacterium pallidum]